MNFGQTITHWKDAFVHEVSGNSRLQKLEEKTAKRQTELEEYHRVNGEGMRKLKLLTEELIEKNNEVKEEKRKYKTLFLKIAKIAEEVFEQRIEDLEVTASQSECEDCIKALDKYKGFGDKVLQLVKTEMRQCQTETDGTNTQNMS